MSKAQEKLLDKLQRLETKLTAKDNVVMFEDPFSKQKLQQHTQQVDTKPSGLWYACGFEWISWVLGEMPGWARNHVYALTVDKRSMVRLRSVEAIDAFDDEFYVLKYNTHYIDWKLVAKEFTGIEICPYQYDRRFDGPASSWYYGWDVASGCIWDPDIITAVDEISLE